MSSRARSRGPRFPGGGPVSTPASSGGPGGLGAGGDDQVAPGDLPPFGSDQPPRRIDLPDLLPHYLDPLALEAGQVAGDLPRLPPAQHPPEKRGGIGGPG